MAWAGACGPRGIHLPPLCVCEAVGKLPVHYSSCAQWMAAILNLVITPSICSAGGWF